MLFGRKQRLFWLFMYLRKRLHLMIIFDYNVGFCSVDHYAFFSAKELFKQIDISDKRNDCWKYFKAFTIFTGIK